MIKTTATRVVVCIALIAAAGPFAPPAAMASEPTERYVFKEGSGTGLRSLSLGVGKSLVVDLPRDVKEVLVADPEIAKIVIRSTRRAYLIGAKIGQTNAFFFDAEGRQIAGFDLAVTRDLNGIRAALKRVLPHADIRVEGIGQDGVLLSGNVATAQESQIAYSVAVGLVKKGATSISTFSGNAAGGGSGVTTSQGPIGEEGVVNAITIRNRDQVMLKVTVAEVQRDIIKQLGVNLSGRLNSGSAVLDFNSTNPFSVSGGALSPTNFSPTWSGGGNSVTATLVALERAGVVRTLAEPTLTAISGEAANFLAGGEFPVLGGVSCDNTTQPPTCTRSVTFKKFGVSLSFVPVVLSEGRISLKVVTEVSELSGEGAVSIGEGSQAVTIPSLRVRRADTTVEIPSGGALAMAGMIQEQTRQAINGVPGLQQVPILGALFRSRDYVNRQTELMVIVTPYIARAVAQKDLSRPDDGFADASDPGTIFLGKMNRIYGLPGKGDPRRPYHGSYGFILD
ncbi:MAG TPA: type II and III secretion system protein family protein [Xanthobacteraceae bacterium]|nr:type II and III secretion system protein family protein [Xanthobacteraceae bacterium]